MLLAKNIPGIYTAKALYSQQRSTAQRLSLYVYIFPRPAWKIWSVEPLPPFFFFFYLFWHIFKHNIKHFLCTFSSNCMNRNNTEQGTKSGVRGLNSSFEFWLHFLGSLWSQLNHLKYLWASTSFIKGGQICHASLTGCVKVSKRYGN